MGGDGSLLCFSDFFSGGFLLLWEMGGEREELCWRLSGEGGGCRADLWLEVEWGGWRECVV